MGSIDQSAAIGKIINNTIIGGAFPFIESLTTMVISSSDINQKIWASIIFGDIGFIKVKDANTLTINKAKIHSNFDDLFFNNIQKNKNIGILFIELGSRKRYRVNGKVILDDQENIVITVMEAYPNCPKYIQQRIITENGIENKLPSIVKKGETLTDNLHSIIANADTFFIGSKSSNDQMDASHRGGQPGFVEIIENDKLKIPEYVGNYLFNTLGNLIQNPNAGLLFIDFENNATLQLNGEAHIVFNDETEGVKTHDTGVYWAFNVTNWMLTENHHQVNWVFNSYSKFNPR